MWSVGANAITAAALLALPLCLIGCGSSNPPKPSQGLPDQVMDLPSYGAPKTKQLAGFVDVTADDNNKLFYYFVEAEVGQSKDVPLLVWLNGGPGASSLTGLLAENLGPQKILTDGTLADNPDAITKKYHLMAVDNPVGSGYSYTSTGAYAKSEEEVRTQFVQGLREFYKLHPEYKANPLWITGESYGGKYVPNVAIEIAVNATDMNLQGIIVGNGLYNATAQYPTIGQFAFGAGVIDEQQLKTEADRETVCLERIRTSPSDAGPFCENTTVMWLYSAKVAGDLFYYDIGLTNVNFDTITASMSKYLNRDDVRAALHVGDAKWVQHDESGPVSVALAADFVRPSIEQVAALLNLEKYKVVMYNGVRDGSVCNHLGNLQALLHMSWKHASAFEAAPNLAWPSPANVQGHIRSASGLQFATILRTGHLVPTVVPESFATLLGMILDAKHPGDVVMKETFV